MQKEMMDVLEEGEKVKQFPRRVENGQAKEVQYDSQRALGVV